MAVWQCGTSISTTPLHSTFKRLVRVQWVFKDNQSQTSAAKLEIAHNIIMINNLLLDIPAQLPLSFSFMLEFLANY